MAAATETKPIPRIEIEVLEKQPDGWFKYIRGRPVLEVAKDLEHSLNDAGLSYEYVSPERWWVYERDHKLRATEGRMESYEWPRGDVFESLEVGGNEGWSIQVYVRDSVVEVRGYEAAKRLLVFNPIRVKLLCSREDAFKAYQHVFHVLGG